MRSVRLLIGLVFVFVSMQSIQAQVNLYASGGNVFNESGSVSYTIGQVFMLGDSGENGSITQGMQQPYEILGVGVAEPGFLPLEANVKLFPNPVKDFLNIKITNYNLGKTYKYYLYKLDGTMLETGEISSSLSKINMSYRAAATYILRLVGENGNYKVFKITKNNNS